MDTVTMTIQVVISPFWKATTSGGSTLGPGGTAP